MSGNDGVGLVDDNRDQKAELSDRVCDCLDRPVVDAGIVSVSACFAPIFAPFFSPDVFSSPDALAKYFSAACPVP